jgi:hypothetical protein
MVYNSLILVLLTDIPVDLKISVKLNSILSIESIPETNMIIYPISYMHSIGKKK